MRSGLIFIRSDDPISRIIMSITKQDYSFIGFYYDTKFFNGELKTIVILLDIFGLKKPQW